MSKLKPSMFNHIQISDRQLRILIALLTFLFLSGIVYIPISSQLGYINESVVIKTHIDSGYGPDRAEDRNIRKAAEYNKGIADSHAGKTFFYRGTSALDDAYLSQLSGTDGIMCVLEIPSINVCVPVGYGTSDEVLETMAGHVCGTSLPVGGPSTNAVIAAHSGSTSSRLFTDLGRMVPGDDIHIYVGSNMLTYRILSEDDIVVVLPYDGDEEHATSPAYDVPFFQVVPGEDLVTLYTCTPIGINSHRLIVRTHRIDNSDSSDAAHNLDLTARKTRASVFGAILMLIPLTGSILMFILIKDLPGKNKKPPKTVRT